MMRSRLTLLAFSVLAFPVLAMTGAACGGKKPPVAAPTPPPAVQDTTPPPAAPVQPRPTPPPPPEPPAPVVQPLPDDPILSKDVDTINKEGILKPVFFAHDSDAIDAVGQQALVEDGQLLKKYDTWMITIEGHCDETGTPEYNLALGDRRALAAKNYLVSIGISADRIKTVSYGEEFPFDPGHDDAALALNRRAHFVLTAKK